MGGGAVKTIVLLMVLVVLSVLVGAQVSDSMKESMGAFAIIAMICIAFGMLLMGAKSWYLLYLVPAFLYQASTDAFGIRHVPFMFAAAGAIFAYGILLWAMGYIRFRWRGFLGLDLLVVCVVLLMVWSFIQYPVSIQAFNPDAEYVGGSEYIWLIVSLLYYIALSAMSGHQGDILKLTRLSFYALCAGCALNMMYYAVKIMRASGYGPERFSFFNIIAPALLFYVYCSAPFPKLISSPKKMIAGIAALIGIFLGGRREILLGTGEALIFSSFLKKELMFVVVSGILFYGAAVLLGGMHVWHRAPISIQRVMAVLPGVSVSQSVVRGTTGSSNTRLEIWALGMDPRTGLIKNYIYGDGFQTETASVRRKEIGFMRAGKRQHGKEWSRSLAESGNWHNGWLVTVHRLGLIGLVVVNLVFVCGLVMLAKVSNAYRTRKEYPFIMALCLPFAQSALSFVWGTQTLMHFFFDFYSLGLIKVLYCTAREEGRLRPLFLRERYVPMTIREIEGTAQVGV